METFGIMSVHLSTKYEMKVFSRHLNAERFCIVSFSENMNIIEVCVMTMSSFWLILSFFLTYTKDVAYLTFVTYKMFSLSVVPCL